MDSDGTSQQVRTHRPANAESGIRLPHERDESNDSQESGPRADMQQAYNDLAAGQVDTDLRGERGMDAVTGHNESATQIDGTSEAAETGASKPPMTK